MIKKIKNLKMIVIHLINYKSIYNLFYIYVFVSIYLFPDNLFASPEKSISDTIKKAEQILSDSNSLSKKIINIKNKNKSSKRDDNIFNSDEYVFPLATPIKIKNKTENLSEIKLRIIDKINGISKEVTTFRNRLTKNGNLIFKISGCLKTTKSEREGYKSFIDIWETQKSTTNATLSIKPTIENIENIANKRFSGWIFSAIPSISHLEHRIHDIRLLSCI